MTLEILGFAFFAAASPWLFGIAVPVPALTWLGVASLGAAKFLQRPRGLGVESENVPVPGIPGWLSRRIPLFVSLFKKAAAVLKAHERFEGEVGGGSAKAFGRWLSSGARAAIYWLPIALLGMLAGAALVSAPKTVSSGLDIANTPAGQMLIHRPWLGLLSRYLATGTLEQAVLLGGLFAGSRGLLVRLGLEPGKASLGAGAVALAAMAAALLVHGTTAAIVLPILGIEAVLIYLYARSKTLLIPLAVNGLIGVMSLYGARMLVLIFSKTSASAVSLPGIPAAWGVLAVLGASSGLFTLMSARRYWNARGWGFLREALRREWLRLKAVGRWWRIPRADGAPKSPVPVLALGSLWGLGVYLASYLVYWGVHMAVPTHEIIPEILRKTLLMPLDELVYVFLIGAALEEWIFRAGLFNFIRDKLMKRAAPRLRFWPAAVLSAGIFSAFHFVEWSSILRFFNVNVSTVLQVLLGVYSFSWAGFMDRVAAGVMLAAIYSRSRVVLVGIIAHFTSNLLEAVGLRWGLSWFLGAVLVLFVFQLLAERKPPKR